MAALRVRCPPAFLRGIAIDQFREAALFAVFRFVLIEESQVVLVERFKEFVPADRLQRLFTGVTGIVDSQHATASCLVRGSDSSGMAMTFRHPATNSFMIGSYF